MDSLGGVPWAKAEPLRGSAAEAGVRDNVHLLRFGTVQQKENSVVALKDLAYVNTKNMEAIREEGGIELIVKFLRVCLSKGNIYRAECKQEAAWALWNLTCNNVKNSDAIREAGGIPCLVQLATAGNKEEKRVR